VQGCRGAAAGEAGNQAARGAGAHVCSCRSCMSGLTPRNRGRQGCRGIKVQLQVQVRPNAKQQRGAGVQHQCVWWYSPGPSISLACRLDQLHIAEAGTHRGSIDGITAEATTSLVLIPPPPNHQHSPSQSRSCWTTLAQMASPSSWPSTWARS
jgi:hypothetical protein